MCMPVHFLSEFSAVSLTFKHLVAGASVSGEGGQIIGQQKLGGPKDTLALLYG